MSLPLEPHRAAEGASATLEVRRARPEDDAARDAWVEAQPRASVFYLSAWRRAVERAMGHPGRDLLALSGGRVVGVLPLAKSPGLLGPPSLISVPYGVYGGPLGEGREIELELYRAAERSAVAERLGRLELRCLDDPGLDLPASDLYATFVRELPDRPEDVLARMPKKSRAEARKARERHGLELCEGEWFLVDLMRLFHRNKRSLGSPGLPARFFHALREELGERMVVHLVRRGTEPLSAVMSFLFRDTVAAYYSGTAEDADRRYSASNFMYMALQEWSVRRGFRKFDFGRSRRDSGAFAFKLHQGFEPRGLHYRYRLVRDEAPPSLTPSNPKTRVFRDAWSRLPLWLTEWLSTPASRYLP